MSELLSFIHTPDVVQYITTAGYVGVYIWFVIFSQVAFVPDEISLLTVGYLAAAGVFNPFIAGAVSLAGFLTVDTVYFFLTRAGSAIVHKKERKPDEHTFRSFATRLIKHNVLKALFIISFIPRMRFWGPIVTSSLKIPYKKFVVFDSLSLGLFIFVYVTLGYFFGKSLAKIFTRVASIQHLVFFSVIIIIGVIVVYLTHRIIRARASK